MDLSIIIVTFNSENVIRNCIESILDKTKDLEYEIIIVDNSSTDETIKQIKSIDSKKVSIIKSENKGFNYGNNRGIEVSKGKYICLLNPDTILLNNAFKIMISELKKDNKIGCCGSQLLDKNMNKNFTFGTFPSIKSALFDLVGIRSKNYFKGLNKRKYKVDYPIGADFLFRRNIIEEIGYLDENYFLYFDETDFGYRIYKNGYSAYIFSDAKIIHLEGESTKEVNDFAKKKFLESYVYYNTKFLTKKQSIIICRINIINNYIKGKIKKIIRKGNPIYNFEQINFNKNVLNYIKLKG